MPHHRMVIRDQNTNRHSFPNQRAEARLRIPTRCNLSPDTVSLKYRISCIFKALASFLARHA